MTTRASSCVGQCIAEMPASGAPCRVHLSYALCAACLVCRHRLLQKEQVQQLATASAAIPALTTSTEELRASLAVALSISLELTQTAATATAAAGVGSNSARWHAAATCSSPQHRSCASPVCAHVRSVGVCSPVAQHRCCSPLAAAGHCQHCTVACCGGGSSTAVCYGAATAGGLLSSVLLPTAGNLRAKMDQLESNLRCVCCGYVELNMCIQSWTCVVPSQMQLPAC
jgi:hypothetical protein